jgi:hypothetical protein
MVEMTFRIKKNRTQYTNNGDRIDKLFLRKKYLHLVMFIFMDVETNPILHIGLINIEQLAVTESTTDY